MSNKIRKSDLYHLFLKRMPSGLIIVVLTFVAFYIIKFLYLDFMPELFGGAHKIGLLFEDIVVALVIATVFYCVVNVGDLVRRELLFYTQAVKLAKYLYGKNIKFTSIILIGRYDRNSAPQFPTDVGGLEAAMRKINCLDRNTPIGYADKLENYTWQEYIAYEATESEALLISLKELYNLYRVEHPELLHIINELNGASFIVITKQYAALKLQNHPIANGGNPKIYREFQCKIIKLKEMFEKTYGTNF